MLSQQPSTLIRGVAGFVDRVSDRPTNLVNFATREIVKGPRVILRREAIESALRNSRGFGISAYPPMFNSHAASESGWVTDASLEGAAIQVTGSLFDSEIANAVRERTLGLCLMLRNLTVEPMTEDEISVITAAELSSVAILGHDYCDFRGTSIQIHS